MVSNTSGEGVTADVFLDFLGERHTRDPLTFRPHETKVLSITKLLTDLKVSPASAPEGGISIVPRGVTPALIAQGRITDVGRGFSTSLNFPDPSLQKSSALHASGVPIGKPTADSPYAGTGTFIPHVIVRNLVSSPQSVIVSIEYPGPEGPEQTALPPASLAPYSTVDLPLDSALGTLPLPLPFCSIRVQYSGPAGSAIAEVTSVEDRGDLVIDSRVANEGDGWAGSGAHPWHVDGETESVLFLTDMGDKPARIGFLVQAGGIHYYLTDLKLKPHETRVIDLRKLRDKQQEDFQKNKIPANAADGSVVWIRLDNVPVMGRLVVLQRHKGMASNYDCSPGQCPAGFIDLRLDPTSATFSAGNYQQFEAIETFVDSNGTHTYYVTGDSTWCTSDTSVASLTSTKGQVKGGKAGSATITATYTDTVERWNNLEGVCDEIWMTRSGSATANVKPNVTGISPSRGMIGVTTPVTVSGKGFGTSATVNAGSGITVSVSYVSDTQISASFQVASSAPAGNHSVTVTAGGQTSNSVNFYVQVPTSLSIVAGTDQTTSEASCTTGGSTGCGVVRSFTYQVNDQAGQPITGSGIASLQFWDAIQTTSPNNLGLTGYTTTCTPPDTGPCGQYVSSSGQFGERSLGACSTVCISNNACVAAGPTNANQTWHIGSFSIVQQISYYCGYVRVNGQ